MSESEQSEVKANSELSSNENDENSSELDASDVDSMEEESGELEEYVDDGESGLNEMERKRNDLASLIASAQRHSGAESDAEESGKKKNRGKGVVYLARIPPLMTARELRQLLTPIGEIGRVWVEEPDVVTKDNTLSNKKKNQMLRKLPKEAWVEFVRAKKAYKAAKLLHCTAIGSGRFKEDLWTIKYLKDFTWSDLVNQHLHRKKMKEQRLRQNISRAQQEASSFLKNRDRQQSIENKKRRRPTDEQDDNRPTPSIPQHQAPSKPDQSGLLGNDLLTKVCSILLFDYPMLLLKLTRIFCFYSC